MEIEFQTAKLKKKFETYELARKEWGEDRARTIIRRINEIQSADCVADLNYVLPVGCQLLDTRHKRIYAVDIGSPFSLLFEAVSEDGKSVENINHSQLRRVKILEVKNHHD